MKYKIGLFSKRIKEAICYIFFTGVVVLYISGKMLHTLPFTEIKIDAHNLESFFTSVDRMLIEASKIDDRWHEAQGELLRFKNFIESAMFQNDMNVAVENRDNPISGKQFDEETLRRNMSIISLFDGITLKDISSRNYKWENAKENLKTTCKSLHISY